MRLSFESSEDPTPVLWWFSAEPSIRNIEDVQAQQILGIRNAIFIRSETTFFMRPHSDLLISTFFLEVVYEIKFLPKKY